MSGGWQIWIDVGGTFTDCLGRAADSDELRRCKVLSSGRVPGRIEGIAGRSLRDSYRGADPPGLWDGYRLRLFGADGRPAGETRVVRSAGEQFELADSPHERARGYELDGGEESPVLAIRRLLGAPLDAPLPRCSVRLGTTRGTNALLTRCGAASALVTTAGFGDLLRIGNQDRPRLFDLQIVKHQPLFEATVEADERIDAAGRVLRPLDAASLTERLGELRRRGIRSLAVCLMHACQNAEHELLAERAARDAGFRDVRLSHRVAPVVRIVPRAQTTVLDAYLDPVLREYVAGLRRSLGQSELLLMTSAGGLVSDDLFTGKDSILSGPAGGVVGCARAAEEAGFTQALGFDMGGTSTDVSRYGGQLERQYESVKAGVQVVAPALAIETVAAGGGSICRFDGVKLAVGPDSAGADPGPACYGRGGPLTVTDLNVRLGRIPDPALVGRSTFPFPLDAEAVDRRLDELAEQVRQSAGRQYRRTELAEGLLRIANENMARAAKSISVDRGYDPSEHLLVAFGGAAAQHACAVAEALDMSRVLSHPDAGLLSALGIGQAQIVRHQSQGVQWPLAEAPRDRLDRLLEELRQRARDEVVAQGVPPAEVAVTGRLDLRYRGLDSTITLEAAEVESLGELYERRHEQLYGFRQDREVEIVAVRAEAASRPRPAEPSRRPPPQQPPPGAAARLIHGGKELQAAVYRREELAPGAVIRGPAIVVDAGSTTVVDPHWTAVMLSRRELLIERQAAHAADRQNADEDDFERADPAQLELFNNQFAGIAEQMGITLRNTSSSVNVKERLDFSCAIFTPAGDLVVNAPHIPVHLGAMSQTVRCVIEDTPDLGPGDVIVTNDPFRGGSHLPDVTVVLPVFSDGSDADKDAGEAGPQLLFFTASRAHHAEIGGLTPGSMPPFSKTLADEGVLIRNCKLIDAGRSQMDRLRRLLSEAPRPSRRVEENMADISAQVAACRQGAGDLLQLCRRRGRRRVIRYMEHVTEAAALKVAAALRKGGSFRRRVEDRLDDGAPIVVEVAVDDGRATIDFTGTGGVLPTNLNANRAIVSAAAMYCLRCLLDEDIPMNEGVLAPVKLILPECLLNPPRRDDPRQCAAVVGGNVETSQRVVDVLLAAFQAAAASQGTMNNLTFGDGQFGYYETICGGAGATPRGDGASAVHTHMTNTRLTDPEVLELRHPVRVVEFSIRRGSGGEGRHRGGDGAVRRLEFLAPLDVSLLTQRRTTAPPGLAGGGPGARGENSLRRAGSETEKLPGCCHFHAEPGDVLTIKTPGGGGWGEPQADD